MFPDLLREPMRIHESALDPAFENQLEPVVQQRTIMHPHQAFRRGVGQRAQPASDSGCKQQRAHGASVTRRLKPVSSISVTSSAVVSGRLPTRETWSAAASEPR